MSKINILLLTNRDSDNVGDQIIEATVISLIKGVMKNLGIEESGYAIKSRAAGIISKKYMKTGDPALLESARKAISKADMVVFGGAPLFNYKYQNFYLRTIKTLELAEEYGVPVLFSSIGVEPFDANSPKSMRLKEALRLECVRQITTRDDFASLQQYMEGTETPIAHVADPAVFADMVFRKQLSDLHSAKEAARAKAEAAGAESRKTVGLVVTRAGIFADNRIDFTEQQQRDFWLETRAMLIERGYAVRLFTTGHFTDEVFLDNLVRNHDVPQSEAMITVNSPEEMTEALAACDGVIAYRLHASITSFAYGIPSIGLTWNFKVPYFYESVGYGQRALSVEHWNAPEVVTAIETAMNEGVEKPEAFFMTVYETLFSGFKSIFAADAERSTYTYEELRDELPGYAGTTPQQYRAKMSNKLRRTYESYYKHLNRRAKLEYKVSQMRPPSLPRVIYRKVRGIIREARSR